MTTQIKFTCLMVRHLQGYVSQVPTEMTVRVNVLERLEAWVFRALNRVGVLRLKPRHLVNAVSLNMSLLRKRPE